MAHILQSWCDEHKIIANFDQAKVIQTLYHTIREKNVNSHILVYLYSIAGVGKTHVLKQLSKLCTFTYIAPTKALIENMLKNGSVDCFTICKYLMIVNNTTFQDTINKFKEIEVNRDNFVKTNYNLFRLTKLTKILAIDESSTIHPFLLLWFIMCAIRFDTMIIFIGDDLQQLPIGSSKIHHKANITIIEKFSQTAGELTTQLRMKDVKYYEFTQTFRKYLTQYSDKLLPQLKFLIFKNLYSKILAESDPQSIFLSAYHITNKKRINDTIDKFGDVSAPFLIDGEFISFSDSSKFYGSLKYCKEISYNCPTLNAKVKILKYNEKNDTLVVKLQNNHQSEITRVNWETIYYSSTYFEWIQEKYGKKFENCYIFPIIQNYSTFARCQGLTIKDEQLELFIDAPEAKSIYVGLTRVSTASQIKKIYFTPQDYINLSVSHYMDDGFFYNIPIKLLKSKALYDLMYKTCTNYIESLCNSKCSHSLPHIMKNLKFENSTNLSILSKTKFTITSQVEKETIVDHICTWININSNNLKTKKIPELEKNCLDYMQETYSW